MSNRRIIILGAGLSGLSVAWHLQGKGTNCQIFEKESEIGGLCRSKKVNGFTFDYDGHSLHFRDSYTFNLIKSLLGSNLLEHQRSAWIYSHGKYSHYPFQANLYSLPHPIIKECLLGFTQVFRDMHSKKKVNNFLDWINQTFGEGIAKHFMIPYNTKFWTVSPQELTCEWLNGLIPIPSLNQIIEGAVKENEKQFGYNSRFWYPKRGGIIQVPLAFASSIKNVHTNCQITEINLKRKEIKIVPNNIEKFDYLISTVPLPELSYLIKEMPEGISILFKNLRWNSIFNLNLGIEEKDYSKRHWIYFPQKEICFFRVGFFNNFSPELSPVNSTSLYTEVAYSKDKPIDKDEIVLHIKEDLKKIGIISSEDKILVQDINDIKYGYPIYDRNYQYARRKILEYLKKNNIISCGRYGSWRYMSIEDCILEGKELVEQFF